MFIFPAWLKHWVSPFTSDCTRISVSGNIHDSAPLNNITKFGPEYVKDKKIIVRLRMWYADIRGHHGKRWDYEPGDWYMGRHRKRK